MSFILVASVLVGCKSNNQGEYVGTGNNKNGFDTSNEIVVVTREEGSGTRGAFVELTGIDEKDGGKKIDRTTKEAITQMKTDTVLTTVAGNEYAIGYVSTGSLNDTVKALNDYLKNGGSDEKNFLDTKHAQTTIKNNIEQLKAYDPIEAVKYDLKATHGLEDEEIEEYISTKNAIDLKIEGNKIKNNWIGELNESLQQSIQQEVEMVKSVELRTQQFNQKVQSYIGELKAVDSIQVNESDKKMLATNLSNPNDFLRKHFPLDKNGLPTKEWVENAQRLLSRPRLASELKTKVNQAETNGGKKVFNNLHNIPTHEAALSSASSNNEKSVAKLILDGIKKAKEQEHYN